MQQAKFMIKKINDFISGKKKLSKEQKQELSRDIYKESIERLILKIQEEAESTEEDSLRLIKELNRSGVDIGKEFTLNK